MNNCNGRGMCDRGRCFCFPGFEGPSCERAAHCPGGCSAHGQCFYGKCFCDPYYEGEDCSESPVCNKGCSHHGICRGEDLCVCEPGYTGVSCDIKLQCKNDCSGPAKGVCAATESGVRCMCKNGWMGDDCSRSTDKCPNDCSGKGVCLIGECKCQSGYTGLDCSQTIGGGTLLSVVAKNLAAADAEQKANQTASQPRFRASLGASLADRSTSMKSVFKTSGVSSGIHSVAKRTSEQTPRSAGEGLRFRSTSRDSLSAKGPTCPNSCSGNGVCSEGVCFCNPGWENADCSLAITCPNACSSNGICQYGRCYCDANHEGADCSQPKEGKRRFPQPWITAILCCVFFFIGMIVGRKTLAYSLKQLGEQLENVKA